MERCPICGREFRNKAGLMGHMRQKHNQPGGNAKVPAETLKEIQEKLSRLEAKLSQRQDGLEELREAVLHELKGLREELKPRHINPPSEQARSPSKSPEAKQKGFDWGIALGLGALFYLLWRRNRSTSKVLPST